MDLLRGPLTSADIRSSAGSFSATHSRRPLLPASRADCYGVLATPCAQHCHPVPQLRLLSPPLDASASSSSCCCSQSTAWRCRTAYEPAAVGGGPGSGAAAPATARPSSRLLAVAAAGGPPLLEAFENVSAECVELPCDALVQERTIEQALHDVEVSSAEYNQRMQRAMANPYEYHHHLGMYYTRITPQLIVGSQPQSAEDVTRLHREEGVDVVLNLQQDHDIAYWGIDLRPIQDRCQHHGMRHYRRPAVDFDPHSLRHNLPRMVAVIEHNVSEGRSVYVHCTAGLGRAPATAIAYLFWFQNMDLKKAYDFLTSKRPCGPKWDAIRGATYDLVRDCPYKIPLEHLPQCAFSDVSAWEREVIQLHVRQLYNHDHHA